MNALLNQLPERDRQALVIVTLALIAALAYWWLWQPLQAELSSARSRVRLQTEEVQQMQALALRLKQLTPVMDKPSGPSARGTGSLYSRVDGDARRAGVSGAVKRMEPRSDGRLRVWFTKVELNKVLAWLSTLRAKGIEVYEFTAQKNPDPGMADIRLVLQDGATP